jgi:hypothetical protein
MKPKTVPTSDRIPGSTAADGFMRAHKWKRLAGETEASVEEILRKASKIALANNKGARCDIYRTVREWA